MEGDGAGQLTVDARAAPVDERGERMRAPAVDAPTSEAVEHLLAALLERPSQQTEAFEADPEVQSYLRETVVGEVARLGLASEADEIGNVIVRLGQKDATERVLFFAYAMTHPAGRMTDPFVPRILFDADGRRRLRGRGATEQKGPLAAALLAMRALRACETELAGEVVLCVSPAGETGRHDTAAAFMQRFGSPAFRWAIVGIGTDGAICVANKGRVDATIVIRGRAGHSSMPWAAVNAIEGAVEVLCRLATIHPATEHPQLGRATITPTSLRSWPPATHTIPDEVQIVVDRRLVPGEDPETALAELRATLAGIDGFPVEVERGPFMYPSEVSPGSALVTLLRDALRAAGRPSVPLSYTHASIDTGFFNHHGIPAVMFGPGEQAMWHTDDEAVAIDDVARCASAYASAALWTLEGPGRSAGAA